MECNKIIAYHGTDEQYVNDIINNGFKYHQNEKHWLGNGIYFYLDYALAEWWATSPTSNFGNQIKKPTVIKAKIISNPINTIDTRILDDYMYLLELYDEFFNELCQKGTVVNSISKEQLRCMFFDWVHSQFEGIEIFIAGFEKNKKHNNANDLKYQFKIPYVEYQMCVFDNDLITERERVSNYEKS